MFTGQAFSAHFQPIHHFTSGAGHAMLTPENSPKAELINMLRHILVFDCFCQVHLCEGLAMAWIIQAGGEVHPPPPKWFVFCRRSWIVSQKTSSQAQLRGSASQPPFLSVTTRQWQRAQAPKAMAAPTNNKN
jgi:hypothetical protein